MNTRRSAYSFAAAIAVALLLLSPLGAQAQRKQAGGGDKPTSPQDEMKKGGKPRLFVASAAGTNESWTNDITRQTLEEALVNSGRFEVIAGTQRDNLLHEQGFSNSDLVDPSQNAKVGRMLAAKYVVSGTCQSITTAEKQKGTGGLGGMFGGRAGSVIDRSSSGSSQKITTKIQIQMTDLEKGTILLTKSYTLDNKTESTAFESRSTDNPQEAAYRGLVAQAASQFVGDLSSTVPVEALVIKVDGNRVILNAGSNSGVQQGMRFEIYSEDEAIKDPSTGEVLDYKTTKYAVISVSEVREKISFADIVKTFADNGSVDPSPNPTRIEAQMSARAMGGGGSAAPSADPASDGGGGKHKKKDQQ